MAAPASKRRKLSSDSSVREFVKGEMEDMQFEASVVEGVIQALEGYTAVALSEASVEDLVQVQNDGVMVDRAFYESSIFMHQALKDPNLSVFAQTTGQGTEGIPKQVKANIRKTYGNRCAFCGLSETVLTSEKKPRKLSCAHLSPHVKNFNQGFKGKFQVTSERNFLLLCGSHGKTGSCRDGFDSHRLALLPACLERKWTLLSCYSSGKFRTEEGNVPQRHQPAFQEFTERMLYNRVLATRLHKFYVENAKSCEKMPNFGGMVSGVRDVSLAESRRGTREGTSTASMQCDHADLLACAAGSRSKAVTKKHLDQGVGYGAEAEAQEAAAVQASLQQTFSVLQHKVEEEEARQSPGFMKELHEKCSRNLATSVPRAASHLQVGTESQEAEVAVLPRFDRPKESSNKDAAQDKSLGCEEPPESIEVFDELQASRTGEDGEDPWAPWTRLEAAEDGLTKTLVDAMRGAGFTEPTPIQAQAWPILCSGRDLIGVARTTLHAWGGERLPRLACHL
eukprot:s1030_g13.t1